MYIFFLQPVWRLCQSVARKERQGLDREKNLSGTPPTSKSESCAQAIPVLGAIGPTPILRPKERGKISETLPPHRGKGSHVKVQQGSDDCVLSVSSCLVLRPVSNVASLPCRHDVYGKLCHAGTSVTRDDFKRRADLNAYICIIFFWISNR